MLLNKGNKVLPKVYYIIILLYLIYVLKFKVHNTLFSVNNKTEYISLARSLFILVQERVSIALHLNQTENSAQQCSFGLVLAHG